jgi:hypothetical protein
MPAMQRRLALFTALLTASLLWAGSVAFAGSSTPKAKAKPSAKSVPAHVNKTGKRGYDCPFRDRADTSLDV